MTPDPETLLAAYRKSTGIERDPPYIAALFPEQRAFVDDDAPRKAALCSRRAGKTEAVAAWLLQGGETAPGELSVYVALTRGSARLILWRTLQAIERRHRIGLRFTEPDQQLMVVMPNGHRLWLAGCPNELHVEKFRGLKYRRAAVDEAASYGPHLRVLVDDVLEPALLDLKGEMALVGTPGPLPAGLFYEQTTGGCSTHRWTVLQNPYIPHAAEWLDQVRGRNRWDEDHPTYQREWLGRWVLDEGALVYPYEADRNAFRDLPSGGRWHYVLGVDLGYEDSTAFVLVATRVGDPEVYVLEADKAAGLIPSTIAAYVDRYVAEYPGLRVVVDSGGLGKGYVEEMRQRYALPVEAAQKTSKMAYVEMMRGDLLSGVLKVSPWDARHVLDEMATMQFTEQRELDERCEDHALDALLYAWRACRATYRPEFEEPTEGSDAWFEREQERMRALAQRQVRRKIRERDKPRSPFRR